jgi:hypothetical protein
VSLTTHEKKTTLYSSPSTFPTDLHVAKIRIPFSDTLENAILCQIMSTMNLVLRLAPMFLHILIPLQVIDAFIAPAFVSKSPRTSSSLVRAEAEFFDDFADAFVEEDLDIDDDVDVDFDVGHFSVFTVSGSSPAATTMDPNAVFDQTSLPPLIYIRNFLSYGDDTILGRRVNHAAKGNDKETVVFCGPVPEDAVRYTSRILDGIPIAHLKQQSCHTTEDTPPPPPAIRIPNELSLSPNDNDHDDTTANNIETTITKLLDAAVASLRNDNNQTESQPNLVLLAYSTGSRQVVGALQTWLQQNDHVQHPEVLLRRAVLVVTLGSVSSCQFPNGPAYLHVAMNDDPFVSTALGVSTGTSTSSSTDSTSSTTRSKECGGVDAQYLCAYSPYYYAHHDDDNDNDNDNKLPQNIGGIEAPLPKDAHNLRACLVQWLSIIMRINGARSFRFLYTVMASGRLDNPYNLEEEVLPAMIRATGGHEWLWDPRLVHDLPSEDEARMVLELQFGYDAYEELEEAASELVQARTRSLQSLETLAGVDDRVDLDDSNLLKPHL